MNTIKRSMLKAGIYKQFYEHIDKRFFASNYDTDEEVRQAKHITNTRKFKRYYINHFYNKSWFIGRAFEWCSTPEGWNYWDGWDAFHKKVLRKIKQNG